MKYIRLIITTAIASFLLSSCIKDELPNSECDITSASANITNAEDVFYQISDTLAPINADYASATIQFQRVKPWADLTALAPRFAVSPGATLYPASGTTRDFSDDKKQVYYCIAEDEKQLFLEMQAINEPLEMQLEKASDAGRHIRKYYVQFQKSKEASSNVINYDFENYYLEPSKQKFYEWSDPYEDGSMRDVPNWASANRGFQTARGTALPEEYPTVPLAGEGVDGSACVKLTTCSTGDFGKIFGMPLAAGNFFLGTFDMSKALTNTLRATRFGENNTLDGKPERLTGYYKYTPGPQMTNANSEPIDGTDRPAIYCIVYKNHDADGNPIVIYGDDVDSSPQIVARADVKDWQFNTTEWVPFSLEFTWFEDFSEEIMKQKGYNFTIVSSSSQGGATYTGALGSVLLIDKYRLYLDK